MPSISSSSTIQVLHDKIEEKHLLKHPFYRAWSAGPRVKALVEEFRAVAKLDTGSAAAGLYCYEKQIPAVAGAKVAGLRDNYRIQDEATLRYFRVHETADVEHAAQWEQLILRSDVDAQRAGEIADRVLGALWAALDEMHERRGCALSN